MELEMVAPSQKHIDLIEFYTPEGSEDDLWRDSLLMMRRFNIYKGAVTNQRSKPSYNSPIFPSATLSPVPVLGSTRGTGTMLLITAKR